VTSAEAKKLLALLKAAFPSQDMPREMVEVYCRFLADCDYGAGCNAVASHIAKEKFFPKISELRSAIAEEAVGAPGWEAAWGEVMRAVSSLGRWRSPEFSHPAVAAAVDCISWEAICNSDAQGLNTLRAQFRDAYQSVRSRAVAAANTQPLLAGLSARSGPTLAANAVKGLLPGGENGQG